MTMCKSCGAPPAPKSWLEVLEWPETVCPECLRMARYARSDRIRANRVKQNVPNPMNH